MDPISYANGDRARLGGLDVTISLTPSQAAALGGDAGTMADWLHSAFHAMALLRTGRDAQGQPYIAGPNDWYTAINDLDNRLIPRLEGVRDAAVRAHTQGGGTVQDLALAMNVARSTAQYRREALAKTKPTIQEMWAVDGGPDDKDRAEGHDPHTPATDE